MSGSGSGLIAAKWERDNRLQYPTFREVVPPAANTYVAVYALSLEIDDRKSLLTLLTQRTDMAKLSQFTIVLDTNAVRWVHAVRSLELDREVWLRGTASLYLETELRIGGECPPP